MPKSNAKTQGLGAFFMTGFVTYKNVLTHLFGAIGVNYSGIFNVKIPDIVSIGLTSQQLNNLYFEKYRTTTTKNETIIELNYIYTLNKHFNIQPDLQYLIHPGASRSITDCLLGILRFEISF